MEDRHRIFLASTKYREPSGADDEDGIRWKASLIEKTWIALMVIALLVAAINAMMGDGQGIDDQKTDKSLKRVLVELVMR